MRFKSRSGGTVSFREALFQGLAPDGSLYLPVERPDLSGLIRGFDDSTGFTELAAKTAAAIFSPELSPADADTVSRRAFTFSPALRRLDESILLLELFHGPSCAFKDFAAQFLAACMERFLSGETRRVRILVATSGDTGSAVAQAFHGKKNIDVVVLYPSGRVSELQEKQLTTLGGNVHAVEIQGSFDDCQSLVKQAFGDAALKESLGLTSANSINIGRLLPQAFYYIWAMTRRTALGGAANRGADTVPMICVPSGNFGNLTAGVYAWHWGLPVPGFIAATNINDIVPQYLKSGIYSPRSSERTLSNAMDVGNPSNFERLLSIFSGDWNAMRAMIRGISATDGETRQAMREVWDRFGAFVDPHTAVGYKAARDWLGAQGAGGKTRQVIVLSTAHPAKFQDIVRDAVGKEPEIPERLARCLSLPKKAEKLGSRFTEFSGFLREIFT